MKKCTSCPTPVAASDWKCKPCQQEWDAYTAQYAAAQQAAGGKGWEHAGCDHAYGYCAA